MYAKIKDDQIVQFPYSFGELQTDNPYTNYGSNTDFVTIFPDTEEATLRGHVLVAGYDQNSGNGAIWRSIDGGNSWTQTLSVPPVPGSNTDIYSIQWTGTQYIATGPDISNVVTGNTWTSPDGATWTKVGTGEGFCLVYNGTRYVLSSNALSMSGSSPGGPFAYDTGSNLGYSTAYSPTLNLWASIFYAYRSSTWFADIYTAPGP